MGRWPCIFMYNQTREADDAIQEAWRRRHGIGAPFGSLRKEWRQAHCRKLNPGGSERCPYQSEDCVLAFREAVMASLRPEIIDGRVYFISVARSSALERADNKPLARDRIAPSQTKGPGLIGAVGGRDRAGRDRDVDADGGAAGAWDPVLEMEGTPTPSVRGPLSRPTHIGSLLRGPDSGARQGTADDGQEGAI